MKIPIIVLITLSLAGCATIPPPHKDCTHQTYFDSSGRLMADITIGAPGRGCISYREVKTVVE